MEAYSLCHLSVQLPEKFHDQLQAVRPMVKDVHSDIKFKDPRLAHVTIARLGHRGQSSVRPLVDTAMEHLDSLQGGTLRVRGIDMYPNHSASYIFFIVEDSSKMIEGFRRSLHDQSPDVLSPELNLAAPHLTIAKYRKSEEIAERYFAHRDELVEALSGIDWEFPIGSIRFKAWCRNDEGMRRFDEGYSLRVEDDK